MQSKGAIKFVAILLALACLWQLSFTLVSSIQEKKAENYAAKAVEEFQNSAAFGKIAEANQAYTLDSLSKAKNRFYIDSVSAKKVYFGYTYKVFQLNLEHYVHTSLEVKTQVDFF